MCSTQNISPLILSSSEEKNGALAIAAGTLDKLQEVTSVGLLPACRRRSSN